MNDQLRIDIARAGGDAEDQLAAINEQNGFLDKYWPARSPARTLFDVATGNPLGDYGGKPDSPAYDATLIVAAIVAVIVILFVLQLLIGRR